MKRLLYILFVFASVVAGFTSFAQSQQEQFFPKNFDVAVSLYKKGVIDKLLYKEQLDDSEKMSLFLAEYYKSSVEVIQVPEMRRILSLFYKKDFSQLTESELQAEFAKLITQIDQLMSERDYSYLNQKF